MSSQPENSGEIVRLEEVRKAYRLGANSVPVLKGINWS